MATQSGNLTYGQTVDILTTLEATTTLQSKRGRKKRVTNMSDETMNTEGTDAEVNQESASADNIKRIQKTVFDIGTFKNVTLYKDVEQPKKPADLKEAQQMVGGSTEALLSLIYTGLVAKTNEDAQKDISGFHYCKADYPLDPKRPPLDEPYTGAYADGDKKATINQTILSMAKMMGYSQGNSDEANAKAKEQAMEIIRQNPVMLKSLQG
jgi:hypothetical protein